ncbi:hypothetical protein [Emcibacter sp. SYSU 3D8]|uniref:hypothetical protein n=1 Tax=Emcibacter sp. SYSU 3D8 TaxID=3133969 RepID=UPI0031FEC0A3
MSRNVVIGLAVAVVVIVGVLFASGFWSANVTDPGEMPEVNISAEPGRAPDVDLDSKKVVIGTEERTVEVPKVETEEKEIDVPVIGVTDGDKD